MAFAPPKVLVQADAAPLEHVLQLCAWGTVICTAGYRGGRIFPTNGKVYLPHLLYSIIFEASF